MIMFDTSNVLPQGISERGSRRHKRRTERERLMARDRKRQRHETRKKRKQDPGTYWTKRDKLRPNIQAMFRRRKCPG